MDTARSDAELVELGAPTSQDMQAARTVVRQHLQPSPLVRADWLDGPPVYLKLDSLLPTGSFKVRGGLAAVAAYSSLGVPIVTASAGNHGLGLSYAATRLGVDATVVVPRTASAAKIEGLRAFDVRLELVGDTFDEAEDAALRMANDSARYVSPYADRQVIAGQATLAHEVVEVLDEDLTMVVPVGGGGLAVGTALTARRADRDVRVIGVEAEASRAVSAAMAAGRVVSVAVAPTLADGLAGNLEQTCATPHILTATGMEVVSVAESAIEDSIRHLAKRGLVVEGSAAVPLAALVGGLVPRDRPVVLALTGRNIAPPALAALLAP